MLAVSLKKLLNYPCLAYIIFVLLFRLVNVFCALQLNNVNAINRFTQRNISSSYECRNNQCVKKYINANEKPTSLETCEILCSTPPFWPQPEHVQVTNKQTSSFTLQRLFMRTLIPQEIEKDMIEAYTMFANNLPKCPECQSVIESPSIFLTVSISDGDDKPRITTNETYVLEVNKTENKIFVNISACTYFGARHALETLTQLIWYDTVEKVLKIVHDITIKDAPKFPHRGLMLDTARNYFPLSVIEKVVDGMAMSKLNVLHLHLTDTTSFPIVLPNNPGFAEIGAYSSKKVYKPEEIKGLIEYARIRGIRVVLEVDAPSHVYAGWDHFPNEYGKILICEEDAFNGHLNPDNPNSLKLLQGIYEDLLELGTDNEYFHLGADEVNTTCYGTTNLIQKYHNVMHLWADYINNITSILKSANSNKLPNNVVIWSSEITNFYLDHLKFADNLVVQFWFGNVYPILSQGLKIVFSTVGHWYLDCGYGPWKPSMWEPVCKPYTTWQQFYEYRPWSLYDEYLKQVLGGEACLWSETVVPDSLEVRLWPRVAAMAERLWSDPSTTNISDVFKRISTHRERLLRRNIKCDAIWPEWCSNNPAKCK